MSHTPSPAAVRRAPLGYVPAVGPRLKIVLAFLFALVAALGATGAYLSSISLLNWWRDPQTYTNTFTLWVFLAHSAVGFVAILPFMFFGIYHFVTARKRPNRLAVKLGLLLFASGMLVIATGLALIQLEGLPQLPTGTIARSVVYWSHIVLPLMAIGFYVWHRWAGPDIQWKWGIGWGIGVGAFVAVMIGLHANNPRQWYAVGSEEGDQYFNPSLARTSDGKFIAAEVLMADEYCMKCHADIYQDHLHSSHRFSSFNNPPYLASVRETRKVAYDRDGDVKAARWCAGCHDPVPFFSGAFDDPKFDDVAHPTAHAGITCTACHAITNVNSVMGNADYTIEEPAHYPFAFSENTGLQWLNNQLIKAKPDFHKRSFMKPFHKSANGNVSSEFCSTCHKVSLPGELNHYKEFLRGQNHYDSFLLSGVSGHGARAFYYPPVAKTNCVDCHMPLKTSNDFGSKDFDNSGVRKVHSHFFPAANTGLPSLLQREPRYAGMKAGFDEAIQRHTDYLRGTDPDGKDRKVRIDLFGIKEGGTIDGRLTAPIRPTLPTLQPGQTYLVEAVVRTLGLGHHFSQGTVDSNEIWVDFEAKAGERVIARSGALTPDDASGEVDRWSHFINVLMLDRNGNRINRRNPQDIFTPLYNHQIPPGAGNVVHYQFDVPADVTGPITLTAKVRYRKFDREYMQYVYGDEPVPKLPIVDMCEDQVILPVGDAKVPAQESKIPVWQRWNDYGIGCLIEGGMGMKRGELRQAEAAFQVMVKMDSPDARAHGYVNLARVYFEEGRLSDAATALTAAAKCDPPPPWWTLAWLNGLVNSQNAVEPADFDRAIRDFESILDPQNQPRERKFDFTKDYVVINQLGKSLFRRSQLEIENPIEQQRLLIRAIDAYQRTLALEPEDLDAHFGLSQCYARLAIDAVDWPDAIITEPTAEQLREMADLVIWPGADLVKRQQGVSQLAAWVEAYAKLPGTQPRLPLYRALSAILAPAFVTESDPLLRSGMANVLAKLHRESKAIYQPDEIAQSRTTSLYRAKHPEANHAAEAIVIYPTTEVQRQTILKRGTPTAANR